MIDFVPVWTLLLGFAVFVYVLLDGFDLGVGMLFTLAHDTKSRNTIMNSIAPIWDGNETWLVFGGLGLLGAFPVAFAVIVPAVYFPILVMLLALIFRGVAFEFRYEDVEHRTFWDHAFSGGSFVATFAQGVVLGAFIQGFRAQNGQFSGNSFEFITPFSMFTGLALICGYGLLGAGWLILKTENEVQALARRWCRISLIATLVAITVVSIWTPLAHPQIAQRWFSWPNVLWLSPVPIITVLLAYAGWRAIPGKHEAVPFFAGVGLFIMSYLGIAISIWPMIVPYHYTLWQAASSLSTQIFLGAGALFLLPIILTYSAWSYWVFRGKVRGDVGYGA